MIPTFYVGVFYALLAFSYDVGFVARAVQESRIEWPSLPHPYLFNCALMVVLVVVFANFSIVELWQNVNADITASWNESVWKTVVRLLFIVVFPAALGFSVGKIALGNYTKRA